MAPSPVNILSSQLKEAHQTFLGTIEGLTDDQANFQPAGTALSIAAIWTHLIESEDMFLSAISGRPTIESTDAPEKFGFSSPQPLENWAEEYPKWAHQVKVQVEPLTQFTEQVFEASEKYIAGLSPDTLEQTKNLGSMGSSTVEHIIGAYMTGHCSAITGEISAIKGIQGLKGYPW